jgi:hypothetical protein
MATDLSAADRVVLERLLTELARRTDGALDFWAAVALLPDGVGIDRPGFLSRHGETLRSLVVVLRALLAGAGLPGTRPAVDRVASACGEFLAAFGTLERFREAPAEGVRSAVESLGCAHRDLIVAIQDLGEAAGCPASYWQQRTPERTAYYESILSGLLDQLRHVRQRDQQPVRV